MTEEKYLEFRERMITKFPRMFPDGRFPCSVGAGWYNIVESLCELIQAYTDNTNARRKMMIADGDAGRVSIPDEIEQPVVQDIKEKFGGLRFYFHGDCHEAFQGILSLSEVIASKTCEECGSPGKQRSDLNWTKTLCDHHYQERKSIEDNRRV